ncbi:hypothetical protein [Prochlorococcus marinus]|uniref:Possible Beta-lactamase n=1 Tax=Prochlorococcus marinus (strain MIT 9211) TaxID=93059 RepID=A9BBU1_PROM4|nr:hypothetical protein [Prochlorococcus marinus]ABX09303.1 possible Beta-lactamase [Prochlorococcus marinus str. MIT 9211]
MAESKKVSEGEAKSQKPDSLDRNVKSKKSAKASSNSTVEANASKEDVLLRIPGVLEYKVPSKKTRIILGALVLALNMLLLVAVGLYFYVPGFKDFIYNIGR